MDVRPPIADIERMTRALGWVPIAFRPATGSRGTSGTAARWVVRGGAGQTAFAKVGGTALTAAWIRTEHANYRVLSGWFLPEVVGFDDDAERPVLALEDLSECDWPPPWSDAKINAVLDALQAIRATMPPPGLPSFQDEATTGWLRIAQDPEAFLGLRLCSRSWIEHALPRLVDAATGAALGGTSLAHLDIRSDNICFRRGRAVIVDWNHASLANPALDIAAWLPSLRSEGGPEPESILPHAPELAAWVAGFFCARAGEAPIAEAPHVRPLQLRQAMTALPWAARALGLPEPLPLT